MSVQALDFDFDLGSVRDDALNQLSQGSNFKQVARNVKTQVISQGANEIVGAVVGEVPLVGGILTSVADKNLAGIFGDDDKTKYFRECMGIDLPVQVRIEGKVLANVDLRRTPVSNENMAELFGAWRACEAWEEHEIIRASLNSRSMLFKGSSSKPDAAKKYPQWKAYGPDILAYYFWRLSTGDPEDATIAGNWIKGVIQGLWAAWSQGYYQVPTGASVIFESEGLEDMKLRQYRWVRHNGKVDGFWALRIFEGLMEGKKEKQIELRPEVLSGGNQVERGAEVTVLPPAGEPDSEPVIQALNDQGERRTQAEPQKKSGGGWIVALMLAGGAALLSK